MCKVEWCNNTQLIGKTNLCRNHYEQMKKYGKIKEERPRGKRNKYVLKDEYAELLILDSEGNIKVKAKVDKDNVEELKRYSFRYEKDKYIKTFKNKKTIYLHQLVVGKEDGLEVDHINRDKLDNRKSNLRIVDRKTNANNIARKENSGITKKNRNLTKPYCLKVKGKYIGYYATLEEAKNKRNDIYCNLIYN